MSDIFISIFIVITVKLILITGKEYIFKTKNHKKSRFPVIDFNVIRNKIKLKKNIELTYLFYLGDFYYSIGQYTIALRHYQNILILMTSDYLKKHTNKDSSMFHLYPCTKERIEVTLTKLKTELKNSNLKSSIKTCSG